MPKLSFFGSMKHLTERHTFRRRLKPARSKRWLVYAKPPFAGPAAVLAYLSRYTHRVAFSNRHILAFDETGVTFRFKSQLNGRSGADRSAAVKLASDRFRLKPTFLWPNGNGVSWSAADAG